MPRIHWRFPIFWKVLASCLTLSALLIAGSYLYAKHRIASEGRGAFLVKHFKRFQNYRAGLGQAVASVAEVLAGEDALRTALAGGAPETATAIARSMHRTLSGKNALRPDVFLVFDAFGKPIYVSEGSPIGGEDLRELEAVARVRAGGAYFNEILVHDGRALQAAGVPILRPDGETPVGGLIIGIALERYFEDYKRQSDDKEAKQHRLSLIRDGEVIASVYPREQWPALAEAVQPSRRRKAREGRDWVEILEFAGDTWDFHEAPVSGFVGPAHGPIGSLYLMRTRAEVKPPEGFLAAVVLGGAGALLVASILAFVITRPVKKLIHATKEIADGEGDLTQRIEVDCNDEMSDLAANINALFENLERLARDVQGASFQVGASSAQISAASKQMLDGVKDQAVKVESSTAAVTELSSSIQQVASNAMEATKMAEQSNAAVSEAIASMNQIRQAVDEAAEKIHELGESGKRIGNIVEVIRQISEQTSLLALNASIEAAHAGEQGRGFAVVADEVSSLARRVGQSAKDIEDLIATIKDQTADAVRTMQNGTQAVENGTRRVSDTLANLKQIIAVVEDTARAVQEQAIVSDEIARNMDAVQKIAGEVLASSEEAVIQGEQLHALAHQLEESVRGFKLDRDGGRPQAPRLDDGRREGERSLPPARRAAPASQAPAARAAQGGRSSAPRERGR